MSGANRTVKILWITNVPLPEASLLMGQTPRPFGGWLVAASAPLAASSDLQLTVASPGPTGGVWTGEYIIHRQFPAVDAPPSPSQRQGLSDLLDAVAPDLVHIFGTELAHALPIAELCVRRNTRFVISIQGLVSVYADHYFTGLPLPVQFRFTARDAARLDNIRQQQQKLVRRGSREIATLRASSHVIGRTTWDRACLEQVNTKARYHHCNEIMRPEFYEGTWDAGKAEPHSIFVSQASYPVKGFHLLLEAMPLVLRRFPAARIRVAGPDVVTKGGLSAALRVSSYGKYLRELVRRNALEGRVEFLGNLDAPEMRARFLESNAFVLPSTIENSPNSLGEAMLLGVPVVAAHVGGVPDLVTHRAEGYLYQADAPYMLAHYLCRVFEDPGRAERMGGRAQVRARKTHDPGQNTRQLRGIYDEILRAPVSA